MLKIGLKGALGAPKVFETVFEACGWVPMKLLKLVDASIAL